MQIVFRGLTVAWCVILCCGTTLCSGAEKVLSKKAKAAKEAADWEPIPGYKYRSICGFNVLINKTVLEEQEKWSGPRKPLEVLELELGLLVRELPPKAVDILRDILIWVEWDKVSGTEAGSRAVACYHPGNNFKHHFLYTSAESFVKSNAVEIVTMKSLTEEHQGKTHRMVLLHEVTHAVHHHLFDYDNPTIKAAYDNAMEHHLYQGKYASTNEKEYFAEVSCAYFSHLSYEPKTRDELKRYDPTGYEMMTLTWGTPEFIANVKKKEAEKASMPKFIAARKLLAHKDKVDQGVAELERLIEDYPDTKAAGFAKSTLEKQQLKQQSQQNPKGFSSGS